MPTGMKSRRRRSRITRCSSTSISTTTTLEAIAKPDQTYSELMDTLKAALAHEEYVTSLINNIYGEAQKVNDFRTVQFLDWFVKEQGEEETNANDMITKLELFGGDSKGLYMLDNELKGRVYAAPSLTL